jgi:hypothetical protein
LWFVKTLACSLAQRLKEEPKRVERGLVTLEVLNFALVLFRGGPGREGTEIATLVGLRVDLAGV